MMKTHQLRIATGDRQTIVDITDQIEHWLDGQGDGLLNVWVPHATAGLAVIELGSGSEQDLLAALERLLPRGERYAHQHGSPGHGADHVVPAFVAPSITAPVKRGKIMLGTWQRIALVDTNVDNPTRTVTISFVPA